METESLDESGPGATESNDSGTGSGTGNASTDSGSGETSTGSTGPGGPASTGEVMASSGPGSTGATGAAGSTDAGTAEGTGYGHACTSLYDPTCGNDGETYDHPCDVPKEVGIKHEGPCFGDCEGSCSVSGSPLTVALVLVALLTIRPRWRTRTSRSCR